MSLTALRTAQLQAGAQFHPDGYPLRFGQEPPPPALLDTGMILFDRTHWGRLRLQGADRIRYLHNQSTNDIQSLRVGQGCDTVLVNSTGRTLDLTTVYVEPEWLTLITSPASHSSMHQWLEKYIFFADQVTIHDQRETTAMFTLMGAASHGLIAQLGAGHLATQPIGTHAYIHWQETAQETSILIANGTGLLNPGYTFIVPIESAVSLWQWLLAQGAMPWGDQAWEWLRIQQGRPAVGAELTTDYNPLEAGLWHDISFSKGCYIGQETIARLNTYQGVKQQLWGLKLTAPATPGTPIHIGEEKVGVLTSYTYYFEQAHLGLGYIRTRAGGAGLRVQIAGETAEVVDIPLAHRGYLSQTESKAEG
jgi:folate-binding protein YgfZ